jgi:hypothetical protein
MKTDINGDTIWTKTYGNNYLNTQGTCVQQLPDKGYIACGVATYYVSTSLYSDIYVLRTNEFGDTLWTKNLNLGYDGYASSILMAPNGDFIVSGNAETSSFTSSENIFIARFSSMGSPLWTKSYGDFFPLSANFSDFALEVQATNDGNFITVGGCTNFDGTSESRMAIMLKFDPLGDTLWTKRYNYSDYSYLSSVKQTSDGGFILLGTVSDLDGAVGTNDFYCIKTDSNGDTIWTRKYDIVVMMWEHLFNKQLMVVIYWEATPPHRPLMKNLKTAGA